MLFQMSQLMDRSMLVVSGVLCYSHHMLLQECQRSLGLSEQAACCMFSQGKMHLPVSFSNALRNTEIIVLFASASESFTAKGARMLSFLLSFKWNLFSILHQPAFRWLLSVRSLNNKDQLKQ